MKRAAKPILVLGAALVAAFALGANALVTVRGATGPVSSGYDAIVVLGAGLRPDGTPSDVLRDRLDTALSLFRERRAARILVSGDHGRAGYDEPSSMASYLRSQGVPDEALVCDHAGFDTFSTASRARHVFGLTRVLVVTQAFHLPRALFLARAEGAVADGVASDRRRYRGAAWLELREWISRPKAMLDVARRRTPRYGNARAQSLLGTCAAGGEATRPVD